LLESLAQFIAARFDSQSIGASLIVKNNSEGVILISSEADKRDITSSIIQTQNA